MAVGASQIDIEQIAQPLYANSQQKKVSCMFIFFLYKCNTVCSAHLTILPASTSNTGRFIMFFVITDIYNNKTKGPTLMKFFTATGKLKKFFF